MAGNIFILIIYFYFNLRCLSIHNVFCVTNIALRLKRITCNPSYNVKEKLSVAAHLTQENTSLEKEPLIISKSLIFILN